MSEQSLKALVAAARNAAVEGLWAQAEASWSDVLRLAPDCSEAMISLAVHALQRGDLQRAHMLADAACKTCANDPFVWLTLGRIRRELGDDSGELQAIDSALSIDPYFLPGVLAKAACMERLSGFAAAAMYYRAALKIAPPAQHWPELLRAQLGYAKTRLASYGRAMSEHLNGALHGALESLTPAQAELWREAISIRAGLSTPYSSQSNQFTIPRLPAIPFFEREQFSWAAALEAKTATIVDEISKLWRDGAAGFRPYVSYKAGEPRNQFAELNNSENWAALHLYRYGVKDNDNCKRVPRTMDALRNVDLANMPGCPNVMFSVLAPHTHIPPHQGETNARVVAHLPLIIPEECRYRVGFEQRIWEPGKLLVFDDTIEHEAHNDSDEVRVVLIFDVWHPHLTAAERDVAKLLAQSEHEFRSGGN